MPIFFFHSQKLNSISCWEKQISCHLESQYGEHRMVSVLLNYINCKLLSVVYLLVHFCMNKLLCTFMLEFQNLCRLKYKLFDIDIVESLTELILILKSRKIEQFYTEKQKIRENIIISISN